MKNKAEIILIGGGGHCKAVIDVIEAQNKYKIAGIIDTIDKLGQKILTYEIIGTDKDIQHLTKKYTYFFIAIGHIKSPALRIKLFELVKENGGKFPMIISPNAYVSKHTQIGEGTIIMHHVVINADTRIGKNCIINTKALIEHDSKIGDNCHVSTSATLNGGVVIGDNCFIGSKSVTKQSINITSNTLIGAGSVVIKNIIESGVYVGNPAKKIK